MPIIQMDVSKNPTDNNTDQTRTRRQSFKLIKNRAYKRVENARKFSDKLLLKEMELVGANDFSNKISNFANIQTPYQLCRRCRQPTPLTRSEFCPVCITDIFNDITRASPRRAFNFYGEFSRKFILLFAAIAGVLIIGFFLYLLT